jgi:predicted transcriptional regulator YdeE
MHYSVAIPNRILSNMHIESDHNDFYTAILGCKTTSIEYLPEGFTGKAIPE